MGNSHRKPFVPNLSKPSALECFSVYIQLHALISRIRSLAFAQSQSTPELTAIMTFRILFNPDWLDPVIRCHQMPFVTKLNHQFMPNLAPQQDTNSSPKCESHLLGNEM